MQDQKIMNMFFKNKDIKEQVKQVPLHSNTKK